MREFLEKHKNRNQMPMKDILITEDGRCKELHKILVTYEEKCESIT